MNDYLSRAGKTILIIIIVVGMLSIAMNLPKPKELEIIYIQDPNYVQNIGEAQRRLKAMGFYDGPIDYKWGVGTEKAYCNYMAIRAIEGE